MLKGYNALALSNHILSRWDAKQRGITNKKLNKVLFYCHGFSLARLDKPLLKNHIEAWAHGPVVKSVYHAFKQFEHRPINQLAHSFDYVQGHSSVVWQEFETYEEEDLFFRVCDYYCDWSADRLEHESHTIGSPWHKVRNVSGSASLSQRIPNHMIKVYFKERFGNKTN